MGKPVEGDPSKSTRWAWAKQTPDGVLSSGNLSADKVKHAWQLMNGNDSRHRITMDKDGARKGRTMMEAPGGMTLKLGQDMEREPSRPGPFVDGLRSRGNNTFSIQVENGNLNIDCQNGDLNIRARNINFEIGDENNEGGNFTVKANGRVSIVSKWSFLHSNEMTVISSNNMLRCMGNLKLELIGGITKMISNSTRGKDAIQPELLDKPQQIPGKFSDPYEGGPQSEDYNFRTGKSFGEAIPTVTSMEDIGVTPPPQLI